MDTTLAKNVIGISVDLLKMESDIEHDQFRLDKKKEALLEIKKRLEVGHQDFFADLEYKGER